MNGRYQGIGIVTGKRNWSYDVNSIIQHLRLPENVFENFVASDILNVKHKSVLLMEKEWKRDISNKPKLRKYITLKENFAIPNYVSTLLPKKYFFSILLWNFTFESRNRP